MKYFCPVCRTRYDETNLAICIDKDNSLLKNLIEKVSDEKKDARKLLNILLENTRLEMEGIGFLCAQPSLLNKKTYECIIPITANHIIEALQIAVEALEEAQKRKEQETVSSEDTMTDMIDAKVLVSIKELIDELMEEDFADINMSVRVSVETEIDLDGRIVLRQASKMDGTTLPKVCGTCHKPVSKFSGEIEEIVIGLLGSPRSAKSSLIASTLHGFLLPDINENKVFNHHGRSGDIYFNVPPDDVRWKKAALDPLLSKYCFGKKVLKTQTQKAGSTLCVSVNATLPAQDRNDKVEKLILTFIDMPGEVIHAKQGLSTEWKTDYLGLFKNVNAIWFCFDFLELRQLYAEDYLKLSGRFDADRMLTPARLESNLEDLESSLKNEYIQQLPPTAFILTKSDEEQPIGPWSPDETPSFIFKYDQRTPFAGEEKFYSHEKHYLKLKPFIGLSRQIRNTLYNIDNSGDEEAPPKKIIDILERVFKERAFFSTSAYSFPPVGDAAESSRSDGDTPERNPAYANAAGASRAPVPFRTRLPLYWTLAVLGKIPIQVKNYSYKSTGFLAKLKKGYSEEYEIKVLYSKDTITDEFKDETTIRNTLFT